MRKLKQFVEERDGAEHAEGSAPVANDDDDFEVLRESPMMGDGKYKLEIGVCVH